MSITTVLLIPFLLLGLSACLAFLSPRLSFLQKSGNHRLGWLLGGFSLAAFALLLGLVSEVMGHGAVVVRIPWLPSLGLNFTFYYDALSALFALMVTGIGALILVYAGYYFKGKPVAGRFFGYLLLFLTAMLGVVIAGDIIALFVFWEATSLLSFLLISYDFSNLQARQGAFKSLLITGSGGIAMLAGLVLLAQVVGSADLGQILASGDLVRQSSLYPAIMLLLVLGAFTKSAQVPFHIWLPDAMTAPTPASAFLHSATMVKAGIFLLARLHPILGLTDLWFWLLTSAGLTTMVLGAFLSLKQFDLKRILAYSTISQLGVLIALLGQDTSIAFKALVLSTLAHAMYKSALFMLAGIIDHETGTRDIRQLGGLAKEMPRTMFISALAALSLAGLPPLFGFLAKETLLATAVHPGLPPIIDSFFPALSVLAGAMLLAVAGIFFFGVFFGKGQVHGHDPYLGMLLGPALPVVLSLALGLLPEPRPLAEFLAKAAEASFGEPVKVSLALWTGINVPLLLSIVAVSLGLGLFSQRQRLEKLLARLPENWTINRGFSGLLSAIDWTATQMVRTQSGALRRYLAVMLMAVGALLLWFGGVPVAGVQWSRALAWPAQGYMIALQEFSMVVAVVMAVASIFVRRDLLAIIMMSASGLAVALAMALEPAPDVSLVQIVVDLLITVILLLTLTRLPRPQRERAAEFTFLQSRPGLLRDGVIAAGSAVVMFFIVLSALSTRPRPSLVTDFYQQNAKLLVGARDVVGAIVIDFRGLDTLIEITVFALAGIGVYTLLRFASPKAKDQAPPVIVEAAHMPTRGVGALPTSPLLHFLAYLLMPLALVIAFIHVMYGHDQPGDGFTAGVILGLAQALYYMVFGYSSTRRRLIWIRSGALVSTGLLLGVINGSLAAWLTGSFLGHVDYGKMLGLTFPAAFSLSSGLFFELAICLAVLGGSSYILGTLGRPLDTDLESVKRLEIIDQTEKAEAGQG
jgi:multicomponent K+:H+ antiporter subunit A